MSNQPGPITVVVATHNEHKVKEISAILADVMGATFVSLSELGEFEEPIEDGQTFEENALIKARAAHMATGLATIADDSGLEVDALDGAPGVHSARYAGEHDDEANNKLLLKNLKDVPPANRTARFVSAIALIGEDGTEQVVRGTVEGTIALEPRGEQGFGYDPLFIPDIYPDKTMAEISPSEKNAISHRGNALTKIKALFG